MLDQWTQVSQPPNNLRPGPSLPMKNQRQKAERLLKVSEQGVSEQEARLTVKCSGSNVPVHQVLR